MIRKIFAICCSHLLFINAFCQTNTYKILDEITKESIPFVHIIVNNKTGIISDYNGKFSFNTSKYLQDSMLFSCVGYKTKKIACAQLADEKTILLTSLAVELTEVLVVSKKIKYIKAKLGITQKPRRSIDISRPITGEPGDLIAVWVPNQKSLDGYIENVNIYISDIGYPNAYFRVHLYECNPLKITPGKNILNQNIVSYGNSGNEWANIDLKKYNIKIPKNGFFVAVEWFCNDSSMEYNDTLLYGKDKQYKCIREGNGIAIGQVYEMYKYSKYKAWKLSWLDSTWHTPIFDESKFNMPDTLPNGRIIFRNETNIRMGIPCINTEVRYVKEKYEKDYQEPKKRKLNKIQKVKKDPLKYPQNSIENLFASIIKTLENDDYIYLLKYLCVYKEDQFEQMIAYSSTGSYSDFINSEALQEAIDEFKMLKAAIRDAFLTETSTNCYDLEFEENSFKLILDKGEWKIYPIINK